MKAKVVLLILFSLITNCNTLFAQFSRSRYNSSSSGWVFKTNVAGLAIGNINAAAETVVNANYDFPMTVHTSVSYNSLKKYAGNTKLRHIALQPEFRMWMQGEAFNGFFAGANLNYAFYNVGYISLSNSLKDNYYQGQLFGIGIAGGYQMTISDKIGAEASLGVGYANMNHDVYKKEKNSGKLRSERYNYFGPNKFSISFVYKL
ncbi:DUF3575 domain-containing protein [Sphingobacterium spiritivorum]|uniref:DUF3575 domain-containing protein n=1 Tax=Sphingobacterium spiritivorum ATCC 33861 TaxID=525373 RepID=D7VGP9_SPHSI|nr:DUF3575 domain-containing protein [Sphingobacterium spiritivorum]EFK59251.1 hypothetical protein HMPREF0766_10168 [Sphingobacterium spiritivorum ATCC 33861]QQT34047.1 DUF3575 domain-containing protein [Sphingobacterium spiritivorum]WQD34876.1 DUF3575 domain-containing protein [Sphingobacterium spiritivorum]SUI98600.1 Protein of uncharacterised function (DUF3575) [Sphingobacterium spiritivorum]